MLWGSRVPFALHKNGIPELFCAGGEGFSLGSCVFVCLLLALVAVQQPVKCLTYPLLEKLEQLWHNPQLMFCGRLVTHSPTHKKARSGWVNSAPINKATVACAYRYS